MPKAHVTLAELDSTVIRSKNMTDYPPHNFRRGLVTVAGNIYCLPGTRDVCFGN